MDHDEGQPLPADAPRPRDGATLEALIEEVRRLRRDLETDLTLAAAAVESGEPAIGASIVEGERDALAQMSARVHALTPVLPRARRAEAPPQPPAVRRLDPTSAVPAVPPPVPDAAQDEATTRPAGPAAGPPGTADRRPRWRRLVPAAAVPSLAAAAALVGLLGGVPTSPTGDRERRPVSHVQRASSHYADLSRATRTGAPAADVLAASARLHASLAPILGDPSVDPEVAEQALRLLELEQALMVTGRPDGAAEVMAESRALWRRLATLLPSLPVVQRPDLPALPVVDAAAPGAVRDAVPGRTVLTPGRPGGGSSGDAGTARPGAPAGSAGTARPGAPAGGGPGSPGTGPASRPAPGGSGSGTSSGPGAPGAGAQDAGAGSGSGGSDGGSDGGAGGGPGSDGTATSPPPSGTGSTTAPAGSGPTNGSTPGSGPVPGTSPATGAPPATAPTAPTATTAPPATTAAPAGGAAPTTSTTSSGSATSTSTRDSGDAGAAAPTAPAASVGAAGATPAPAPTAPTAVTAPTATGLDPLG